MAPKFYSPLAQLGGDTRAAISAWSGSRLFLCVLMSVFLIKPAQAVFAENFDRWQSMPQDAKLGFVIGVYDSLAGLLQGEDPYLTANTLGFLDCGKGVGLTPQMMVQMIDLHYLNHPDERETVSAVTVLHGELVNACKDYINTLRSEHGLDPIPE